MLSLILTNPPQEQQESSSVPLDMDPSCFDGIPMTSARADPDLKVTDDFMDYEQLTDKEAALQQNELDQFLPTVDVRLGFLLMLSQLFDLTLWLLDGGAGRGRASSSWRPRRAA